MRAADRVARSRPPLDLRGLLLAGSRPVRARVRDREGGRPRLDEHDRARRAASPAWRCWRAFVAWELRAPEPMLPMRFFRSRGFTATSGVTVAMFFGTFGSIFLLAQFFQTVQGYSPLEAGLRTLPWTGVTILVAPIAGILSDRIGSRAADDGSGSRLQAGAMALLALVSAPDVPYAQLVGPFAMAGAGMALVFAPGRERGAQLGAPAGGRPGVRRDQHVPRDRRRARRLGPLDRVRGRRLLRLAAGVHRRHDAGRVGRRGRARRRRRLRAVRPRPRAAGGDGGGEPRGGGGGARRPPRVASRSRPSSALRPARPAMRRGANWQALLVARRRGGGRAASSRSTRRRRARSRHARCRRL